MGVTNSPLERGDRGVLKLVIGRTITPPLPPLKRGDRYNRSIIG